ncbi:MAG: capsule biosynthesis protein [Chloroflexi bacterium]|nr:capsule biosynthesis protein [Chloroflexota bacterium]
MGRRRKGVPTAHDPRFPDWQQILAANREQWDAARRRAAGGPPVLVASTVGGYGAGSVFESMLSVALTLRGARVHTLLCDRALPGCQRAEYTDVPDPRVLVDYQLPDRLCDGCFATGRYNFAPLGLSDHRVGALASRAEKHEARRIANETPIGEIRDFAWNGLNIGEHAYAGALRYFARGDLEAEALGEPVLRRYLEASILMAAASTRLIQQEGIQIAAFNHGLYVPQGVLGEVCRRLGVRVANWNPAYRTSCFIFSHGDTYHHTLMAEPTEAWDTMAWTPALEAQIQAYLKSRWSGSRDWIWFHDEPDEDFAAYAREVGLDLKKPIVGLLTNVMWDAQLHYPANAFPSMLDWVLRTIEWFKGRPDLQLLIRVHPAEIRGTARSRQPLVPEIEKAFPDLPPNVFIIPPESQISTYAAVATVNAAIIYGTKTGVELTSSGIPTIVAGEAWIRNKGITLDASSPDDYFGILDTLPLAGRMPPEQIERARQYAFHFFFRRMVPVPAMVPTKAVPPFRVAIDSLDDLLPGKQPGLDIICDGILRGSPFIYPAETYGLHDDGR